MGRAFDPEKYNMAFCPLCNGNGKLPGKSDGQHVCKECGGFGLIKKEAGVFDEVENKEQMVKVSQRNKHRTK